MKRVYERGSEQAALSGAGLRPALGGHEIRKNKQRSIVSCLFLRIS